jgi:ATP-dependent DNA helicase RecG
MPVGRLPIKTHIVPDQKRADMYSFIAQALDRGEQAYVICPLVEESDNLQSVRAATSEYERLVKVFSRHRLALLHGRMKAAEKDQILEDFKQHTYDLLVATPVVEVGIDVPNATILLIEGAERFGLAQLHQLRGRVGRGAVQSYCFLLSDSTNAEDSQRLHHLEHEHSGIRLAELDLQTRGPGEVYGVRQSGIPELKAANFFDLELIEKARQEAETLWESNMVSTHSPLKERLNATTYKIEMN